MATEQEIEAYLKIKQMDETESYLKRGRAYSSLNEEELSEILALEFDRVAPQFGKGLDWEAIEDLCAELRLRGISGFPGNARDAFERLRTACHACDRDRAWMKDPQKLMAANAKIERDIADALSTRGRRKN